MTKHVSKLAVVNGVNLHYVVAGEEPVVLGMHGRPQNHREFLPLIDDLAGRYRFIAPDEFIQNPPERPRAPHDAGPV